MEFNVSTADRFGDELITPRFSYLNVIDQAATERTRKLVEKQVEVVQLHISGDKNFSPYYPVNDVYKTDGINAITYAERFKNEYAQFLNGDMQFARGTPLEELLSYGLTPAMASQLRARNIYTAEQLVALDGPNLKNLGMMQNDVRTIARAWSNARMSVESANAEVDELRAELARLRGEAIPEVKATNLGDGEDESIYADMQDDELRELVLKKTGQAPHHRAGREKLLSLLNGNTEA